ncbi:AMP-binding protein [Alloiococcus sp. CFN-8]|uniref:AMP-binding protein n=1 Tax=Alloiococcus sp. CFN-8 TaxID=3416081 RepID=UPI003CEF836E
MKRKLYQAEKLRDIRTLVKRASDLYGDRVAYKEIGPKKKVLEYSFIELEKDMEAFGTALLDLGLEGKHIALLGENSYSWVISYLSVINGVGVVIPLDKELTYEEIALLIQKSDTTAIICSSTYSDSLEYLLSKCPSLETSIIMGQAPENSSYNIERDFILHRHDLLTQGSGDYSYYNMRDLIFYGQQLLAQGNRNYLGAPIDVEALAEIIFTSGTTGANKGVMLSHKNIITVVYGAFHLIKPGAVSISVLPLSHSYECSCHILGGIYCGLTVCFNDSLKNLKKNLLLFKPNFSIMVPLFIESMDKMIWKQSSEANLTRHLKYGIWFSNLIRKFYIDKRKLFFKPILQAFGGNLEQIVCGGAPLRSELVATFDSLGINVVNGYGISECAPLVAANCSAWKKIGSVGYIVPTCKVRIAEPNKDGNGSIQVKGDNVMLGYYKDEESTRMSFTADGWFITGDIGYLDKDGFLYITGRTKNLIILDNGKNVYPEELEEYICNNISYVKEVIVSTSYDSKEKTINAYIYFHPEDIEAAGYEQLIFKTKEDIKRLNKHLSPYKRINNIFISHKEFEKTTTKKIKRQLLRKEDFVSA